MKVDLYLIEVLFYTDFEHDRRNVSLQLTSYCVYISDEIL